MAKPAPCTIGWRPSNPRRSAARAVVRLSKRKTRSPAPAAQHCCASVGLNNQFWSRSFFSTNGVGGNRRNASRYRETHFRLQSGRPILAALQSPLLSRDPGALRLLIPRLPEASCCLCSYIQQCGRKCEVCCSRERNTHRNPTGTMKELGILLKVVRSHRQRMYTAF